MGRRTDRHPAGHPGRRSHLVTAGRRHRRGTLPVTFTSQGDRGWAVGDLGTVLATDDGGQVWKPQDSGTSGNLKSIWASPDGSRAHIVGDGSLVLATSDGGASWTQQSPAPARTCTASAS
ncbi:WD40/YVTN/BNR-like repeat-containing protein [Streptomyces sp. NPDC059176]|uniref:WD40/YVTN/BNR-like repeat-containing protein n=1 Tax=Streptomyces sp. NPDC059176 TaxID=3346758 RepID=UPI003689619C